MPDGNVLRLKDVARVELGTQSYAFDSNVDGHPSCTFMVFQVAGSNATEVNENIAKLLEDIEKDLPEGLEFMTMMSSNDFLFASIHEVVETLVVAIILVILVVYFFLQDFKSTLIPSISIIVSLVGTFASHANGRIQYQHPDLVCLGVGHRYGSGRLHRGGRGCAS